MEESERIARAVLDAFDAQDEGALASVVSRQVVVRAGDGTRDGADELLAWFREMWQAIPERRIERTWLTDGPLVGWQWHLRGTHLSGRDLDVRGIGWAIIEDGVVQELGQVADRAAVLSQLAPPPEPEA